MNKDLLKKAGRMIVAGIDGTTVGEHARFCGKELFIGNWILFMRNISSPPQVKELNEELRSLTRGNNGMEPFISIDQEGGIVSRLHGEMNIYPGAMACGAAGEGHAAGTARIMAEHLHRMGFNMNLAPVADINSNPLNPIVGPRSYGDIPEAVADQILELCRVHMDSGIIPVLKHFPGHGDTGVDSHLELPTLHLTREELEHRELIPFIRAIAEDVPAIMVAHMSIPSLDDTGTPSSLSEKIISGFLRESLGFRGLVLTDCLEMEGIQSCCTTGEAVVKAVTAGADLLYISHRAEEQEKGVKALYDQLVSGKIPESRINESLRRMEKYKTQYFQEEKQSSPLSAGWTDEDKNSLRETSRRSLTVLKDRGFLKPSALRNNPRFLILHLRRPEQFIGENTVAGGDPAQILKKAFPKAVFRTMKPEDIKKEISKAPIRAEEWEKILIVCSDLFRFAEAMDFVRNLLKSETSCAVAVMRTPYEGGEFTRADALILTYEDTPSAYTSLAEFLNGEFTARGVCPVKIPGLESLQ
ncbi:glycoside hydrolase family 3 N-terminal domain-containing protein [Oceanispirochaeta sp.]|uniref:glycoside hydrolase family 3 protein n=1 Tax=Oceanispirochaeta sp. TaxID=2035350 RepID=UPI00261B464A|nr:glycoside hydrolase family 3 N-terminal domain-containing protein [Oceanispirochaeta sp.]MDA3957611.1 hypothetical protein [Oceanispirochaeta sp.]